MDPTTTLADFFYIFEDGSISYRQWCSWRCHETYMQAILFRMCNPILILLPGETYSINRLLLTTPNYIKRCSNGIA